MINFKYFEPLFLLSRQLHQQSVDVTDNYGNHLDISGDDNVANYYQNQQNINNTIAENQKDRDYNSAEAQKNRDWESNEAAISRDFNASEAQKNRDFQANQAQIERDYNSIGAQMQRAKDAGVNPLAALGNTSGGAGVPSGSSATSSAPSSSPASSHGNAPVGNIGYNDTSQRTIDIIGKTVDAGTQIGNTVVDAINSLSDSNLKNEQAKLAIKQTETADLNNTLLKQQTISNPDLLESTIMMNRANARSADARTYYDQASAKQLAFNRYDSIWKNVQDYTQNIAGQEVDMKKLQLQVDSTMAKHYDTINAMAADIYDSGITNIYQHGGQELRSYVDKYLNSHGYTWSNTHGWQAGGSAKVGGNWGPVSLSASANGSYNSQDSESTSDSQSSGHEQVDNYVGARLANRDMQSDLLGLAVLQNLMEKSAGSKLYPQTVKAFNEYCKSFEMNFKRSFEENWNTELERWESFKQ